MTLVQHCLWFDGQAEAAARFYCAALGGEVGRITRYSDVGQEVHGQEAGTVMAVEWELLGQRFVGINGGPQFPHSEAYSIQLLVDTQEELDRLWTALTADGGEPGHCGWLKDRFGVSWQVTPRALADMLQDGDPAKVARVTEAFLGMKRFDLRALRKAYEGP